MGNSRQNKLQRILERDGPQCWYCHVPLSLVVQERGKMATFDHIVPPKHGGTRAVSNGRAACKTCNTARGDSFGDTHKCLYVNHSSKSLCVICYSPMPEATRKVHRRSEREGRCACFYYSRIYQSLGTAWIDRLRDATPAPE